MSTDLAVLGADTANQQSGGGSFFDTVTMFTGSAVLSGLAGIYNTAVDFGSKIGVDAEQLDTGRMLENYDQNWYNYYKDNQQLIDTAGFIGTSFIPGTLAIKGLKAVQAARATGAIGRAVTGTLNFANAKRDAALAAGLEEISREGGSAYAYINANKLSSIAWGFADQALQAGAFESAVALTMKDSPILADRSNSEIFSDIGFGAMVGGGFGGIIDGLLTQRTFKNAVAAIAGKQRNYDTPGYYSNLGLGIGDEAYGFVDSLLKLPKDISFDDRFVNVNSALTKKNQILDIEQHLKRTLDKTERDTYTQVQLTLQKLGTDNTPEVGQAVNSMILKMVREGVDNGAAPGDIKQAVGNYLLGLKNVRILNEEKAAQNFGREDLFYINHEVDVTKLPADAKIDDFLAAAKNRKPFEKNATARPYEVVGDPAAAKVTSTALTFEEAWAGGNDLAIIGGKMRVNPKSEIFQQVKDPNLIPARFVNTRTAGVSDSVVSTWADQLPAGAKASDSIVSDGVLNGKTVLRVADEISPSDAYTATARHAWASSLKLDAFVDATVDASDISRLERLAQLPRKDLADLGVKLRDADGGISNLADTDIARILSDAKIAKMKEMLDAGVTDMREIAYVINAPDNFLERAIANGFERTSEDNLMENMSRDLREHLLRENFIATWASPRSLVDLGVVDAKTLEATEAAAKSKGAKYVDTFVTGDLGFMQRVDDLQLRAKNGFFSVFGSEDASRFMEMDQKNAAKMADELGVGAGALSFSNADYGNALKLWSQHTGMLTHQLIQKVANANLEKLQPYIDKFIDDKKAGAELGIILNMLRRSSDKFVLAVDARTGLERLAVRDVTSIEQSTGIRRIVPEKLDEWVKSNSTTGAGGKAKQAVFEVDSPKVLDFLHTWKDINGERINKRAVLMNARGATLGWDPDVIYAPPINTQKFPYFAFVKIKEGHIVGNSDVGMITARSPEELSKLSGEIDTEKYDVFFKRDTEQFYRVKNEYDSQLTLNEPRVDSALRKQGKLGDFFYEVRPESVLEDFIQYSQNADSALVRHGVETRYGQLVTELNALGKQYTEVATSQMAGLGKQYDKSAINPFGDYVRTALDISKRSSFPLVHQLNEFVDSVGTAAYRILVANTEKARAGVISWQDAEKIATKYGIGGVYNADNVETAFAVANRPMDRNLIREGVSKVNMFLATAGLRLDFANSLVNIISMPIMLGTELASLKSLAKKDPSAIGELSKVFSIDPAIGVPVPSYPMLIGNAIKNVLGDGGKDLIESYRKSGDVKSVMLQFHEMMGDLSIKPQLGPKKWFDGISKWVDAGVEKGSKWTGNNFAEDFTRALSANVMDQLTAPLVAKNLLTSQEAAAYRSVFVNRVNGNYIASQRPILFQGTVGAAISLFQTYVFNVMQQMTRHIENRDTRALLTMGGLQGATYGLNGLPFFDAVNTHLIGNASINDGHRDMYSAVTQLAGADYGNWLLYGTASAFPLFGSKSPALYTRGDINPRHISILPVSPLDIPAVDVSRRIVANIADIGSKIVQGGSLSASLLEGLEHNGVSRPLAGLAQLADGYATTSKGSLISSANEFDAVVNATRALGAKPMDESVAMNTLYRLNAYKAADLDRLSALGEAVKTKLRKNQMPDEEDMQKFMKQYASAGGNLQNYSAALMRWSRDANMSVVNQMKTFHNSQYAQRLSEIMGGTTLDDYMSAAQQGQVAAPQ
jgi:hypothetical protein